MKQLPWTASSSSYLFLNSRLHLVMTSPPPVIMAGEQEVNQRSIISQPAPGGKGASHATTPPLCWDPCQPGNPSHRSALQRPYGLSPSVRRVSVPGHTCDTALTSQWEPSCGGAYFRVCAHAKRKRRKERAWLVFFGIALCCRICLTFFKFLP